LHVHELFDKALAAGRDNDGTQALFAVVDETSQSR
jgi:hypothetical protein